MNWHLNQQAETRQFDTFITNKFGANYILWNLIYKRNLIFINQIRYSIYKFMEHINEYLVHIYILLVYNKPILQCNVNCFSCTNTDWNRFPRLLTINKLCCFYMYVNVKNYVVVVHICARAWVDNNNNMQSRIKYIVCYDV